MNPTLTWLTPVAGVALAAALAPQTVAAQEEEVTSAFEEIVVLGTRRQGRTAIETAVPFDVFNRQDIDSVSSEDMVEYWKNYTWPDVCTPADDENFTCS